MKSRTATLAASAVALVAVGGCGLNVQSADLFLLTRTGAGPNLTLLVSDGGTVRCNRAKSKSMPDSLLITARDLAANLAADATSHLSLPPRPGTIFSYKITLQPGTIMFSDRDTTGHPLLAQAELFAVQVAQQVCGLSG